MPAGLGTLFVGLLLIVLAFVEGQLRLDDAAPDPIRAVRLRQLCAGRGGVLSGHPLHPGARTC